MRRCVFGYEGRDKIVPQTKGTAPIDTEHSEGFDEWHAALKEDEVQFSLVRVVMGDRESKRPKFVFVSWVGSTVSVMKKAKVSIHKSSVKEFIGVSPPRDYALAFAPAKRHGNFGSKRAAREGWIAQRASSQSRTLCDSASPLASRV